MSPMKEVNDTIYRIIGACMEVHKSVGPGFPVDIYKKALEIELKERELDFEEDKQVDIVFKETSLGTLPVDFYVKESVVLVLRSQDELSDTEIQRVLRFMARLESPIGLLMNFGNIKIQYKRVLPSRNQPRDIKSEGFQPIGYRDMGRTREGNPIM